MRTPDAVRASYDTVADDYADLLRSALAGSPTDRAVLGLFAELVTDSGGGEVADLGCGPGRITGHLASLGLDVRGVDLSPGMVAVAQREHPQLRFDVGSMTALDPCSSWPASSVRAGTCSSPSRSATSRYGCRRPTAIPCRSWSTAAGRRPSSRSWPTRASSWHTRLVRDPEGREKSPQAYLLARKRG
jgi:hypothetical protein